MRVVEMKGPVQVLAADLDDVTLACNVLVSDKDDALVSDLETFELLLCWTARFE